VTDSRQKAKLFVFEGPDGSGKTTLSSAFVDYLRSEGLECDYFAYPGQEIGTIGRLVYDIHHDSKSVGVESITPTSLQMLHIAAHVDAIESRILPALNSGTTVVLDRFWWSTWVYGRVGSVNPRILRTMIKLEQIAWSKALPTVVFLIERTKDLQHRSEQCHKLSAEYAKLAQDESLHYPVRKIDNVFSLDKALEAIIEFSRQDSVSSGSEEQAKPNFQSSLPLSSHKVIPTGPLVFSRLAPAKPTRVFDTYWEFAAERQSIFFKRLAGDPLPWTTDPILREYKFTNAYRASDRVSQYLIRNVIYSGDQNREELFFRILLFKFFNKIETWEMLLREVGGRIAFTEYTFERYNAALNRAIASGERIYSAAYIMPSGGPSSVSERKHQMHLRLLEEMMRDELPGRLEDVKSMKMAFELLRSYQTIGDFLAYQFVTDLNYGTLLNFSEMDFVVPGPGARDGIRKCFQDLGGLNESEIIRIVADRQHMEFEQRGLSFQSLWGRPLQLIDCQNLFCEVDKYARIRHPEIPGITGRTRIKQRYKNNPKKLSVWYPPKWGLNEKVVSEDVYV
jgi:thymidylate kinase